MKKVVLSMSTVLAMSTFALGGGDVVPAINDDGGFYIGLEAGYLNGKAEHRYLWGGSEFAPRGDSDPDGSIAGILAGYQRYFGNYLLGLEADFMMSGSKGSFEDFSGATSAGRSEINYIYSLRIRAGYRFDSWDTLAYLTVGYGGADVDLYGGPAGSMPTDGYTAHYHGGVFGGGLEKAFGKHVHIRLEYRYSNLGTKTGSLLPGYGDVEMPVKLKTHQFIGAVYYQF